MVDNKDIHIVTTLDNSLPFPREQLYSTNGHKRSKSLFVELQVQRLDVHTPFLSLRPQHSLEISDSPLVRNATSLRDLYIRFTVDDPSEVTFAETVFGDWSFWENILACEWFKPYHDEWSRVTDVKRKQEAFEVIIGEVKSRGKNSFQAAKYLVEEQWKGKSSSGDKRAARSTARKTATEAFETSGLKQDLERLKEQGHLN
jgi:hypothetical protein